MEGERQGVVGERDSSALPGSKLQVAYNDLPHAVLQPLSIPHQVPIDSALLCL